MGLKGSAVTNGSKHQKHLVRVLVETQLHVIHHAPSTFYNTSRFLRLFVWTCNFYQYHIWNHLTHDPFNFLCIEYLQICCANNIYEIYRTSIREVFAMFTKPLIKNIHLAALKAFYIAIRKLKVCLGFFSLFLYVSLGEIDALTFL